MLTAVEATVDLTAVARRLGFDVLLDADDTEQADDAYQAARADGPTSFHSSLYAVAADRAAFDRILATWRTWRATDGVAWGSTPLRDLFLQLKDIRPWGPADRLQLTDWRAQLAGALPEVQHPVVIELWFYEDALRRSAAQRRVTAHLERDGGRVLNGAVVEAVGYHGLACELPAAAILSLADRDFGEVRVVRSADVMFLRASGQQLHGSEAFDEAGGRHADSPPTGDPVLCLLDGVPMENHERLAGRIIVNDPDGLTESTPTGGRRHGTAMASVAVWGDLAAGEEPAARPVLLRPVMAPSLAAGGAEEIPHDQLVPDLMQRVFRELFATDGPTEPVAPQVVVVSLSLGDPATPFATLMSSWARTIDHLSDLYGVLVVVSAGNWPVLELTHVDSQQLTALRGDNRRRAVLEAVHEHRLSRSLLSPAEAINAVTVGALHDDASGTLPAGYLEDPSDGTASISPVSALGSGLRRSVKPEVAAAGGRVTFPTPLRPESTVSFARETSRGPGIQVASPTSARGVTHTTGTSPAAASVARKAARLAELVDGLFPGAGLTRHERAVAVKALLVHGAEQPEALDGPGDLVEAAIGHGRISRDLAAGCGSHEATVLFLGNLHAQESQRLALPLPDGLSQRAVKKVTATLAWLSPVNWRHRQYRRAKLEFATPAGPGLPALGTAVGVRSASSKRGATTVQHGVWTTERAFAVGYGDDLPVMVTCLEQAGGLRGGGVPYAVAVTLWVSPALSVDVYSQVAAQVRARAAVRPPVR